MTSDSIIDKIETGSSFEAAKSSCDLLEVIDQIQEIRSRNNKNWMDILRIAFKYAPDETREVFKNITECDIEINKLSKQLGEIK